MTVGAEPTQRAWWGEMEPKAVIQVIRESGEFDADWYSATNADVSLSGIDPVDHYCQFGWKLGRDPSPRFNTRFYLAEYPDVAGAGLNPLWHYVIAGKSEGRACSPGEKKEAPPSHGNNSITAGQELYANLYSRKMSEALGARSPSYAPLRAAPLNTSGATVRPIAFYLPQFHPIPENDHNWGKGFTEWTNVSKAQPQFVDHYQPRYPGELGFYDLRAPETMARQIELAKLYGIAGFCFHYYWFSGKRVLERPLDMFLGAQTEEFNFPFCLCWANENWTRRWDGSDDEVILAQTHCAADHEAVIDNFLRYFKDPRYIKVENRPVLVIYRCSIIGDLDVFVDLARQKVRAAGFDDILLVATTAFGFSKPAQIGFDAICEFPPHAVAVPEITSSVTHYNPQFSGKVFSYNDVVDAFCANLDEVERTQQRTDLYFPGVMLGWDNEARRPGRGNVFTDYSVEQFYRWLTAAFGFAARTLPEGARFVFVNAWNEWAEGTYLEPDRRYGYAALTAVSTAIAEAKPDDRSTLLKLCEAHNLVQQNSVQRNASDTAIAAHIFYSEFAEELACFLEESKIEEDVFITVPDSIDNQALASVLKLLNPRIVIPVENRGRDIYPFILKMKEILNLGYDRALKVHSKGSLHLPNGREWRQDLLRGLLAPHAVDQVNLLFNGNPLCGIAAPEWAFNGYSAEAMADNRRHYEGLLNRANIKPMCDSFVAGSMFWFRPKALSRLVDLSLGRDDFGPELGAIDGTLAHAVERAFTQFVVAAGYNCAKILKGETST